MKQLYRTALMLCCILTKTAYANINAVDTAQIGALCDTGTEMKWLLDNQDMYNSWTAEWNYDIPKKKVAKRLTSLYLKISKTSVQNTERELMLGEIAHYLYNLEQKEYFAKAVDHYRQAAVTSPNEFRCPWFLGYHYAQAAMPDSAILFFKQAKSLLRDSASTATFWEEYAFAAHVAGMPSHTRYALKKANIALGFECELSGLLSERINTILIEPKYDSTYKSTDLWTIDKNEGFVCVSRPLGIRFTLDTTYSPSFTGYKNNTALISIIPPQLVGSNGEEIKYTIALMAHIPRNGVTLRDYIGQVLKSFPTPKLVTYKGKYGDAVAYEVKDPRQYAAQGGGHFIIVGYERPVLSEPGLLLEDPIAILGEKEKVQYYRLNQRLSRFPTSIYYVFLLDTCEMIYEASRQEFDDYINRNITIE